MTSSEFVVTQVHRVTGGNIFQITINRPDVHNAVNGPTAALLLKAFQRFLNDDDLTVGILHGAGDKSFCAGADLSALNTLLNFYATENEIEKTIQEGTGPMGGSRLIIDKPLITVSQGYTYAGGIELFSHGHIRIAEKQAMFSVACRRWGVPLVDGGTVYLPRLLGWGAALPLILTGQRIRAKRAHEIGLVWEVTEKGKGLERAMSYATQLCDQPRDAMYADLRSVIYGSHLGLKDALKLEAKNIYPVVRSESMKEGVRRFQEGDRFWFR